MLDIDILNCSFVLVAGLLINFVVLVSCLMYKTAFVVGVPKISDVNSI